MIAQRAFAIIPQLDVTWRVVRDYHALNLSSLRVNAAENALSVSKLLNQRGN